MVVGIFAISMGTLRSTHFKVFLKFTSYPLHIGAVLYCIFRPRYYIAFFGQRTSHTNHKTGYKGVGAPRVRNPLKTYFALTFLCLIVREPPVNLFLRFNPFYYKLLFSRCWTSRILWRNQTPLRVSLICEVLSG